MINSDFDEEYFRVENQIDTNEQQFFTDREGVLIFTTPIFTEQTIRSNQTLALSNNIQPEQTNLIVDNITLFSTNPKFDNYLPLKIRLDDKIKIEFTNTGLNTLDGYKVVTNPPVNLNTISNYRWTGARDYNVDFDDSGSVSVNVVATDTDIYTLQTDGTIEKVDKITGVITNVPFSGESIYANLNQVVMLSNGLGNDSLLRDLRTNLEIIDYGANDSIVDVELTGKNLYVTYGESTGQGSILDIFEQFDTGYRLIFRGEIYIRGKIDAVNFFSTTLRLSGGIGDFSNILDSSRDGQYLEFIAFLSGGKTSTLVDTRLSEEIDNIKNIYLSGSDISNPIVNVFSGTGGNLVWNIIDDWSGLIDAKQTTTGDPVSYTKPYRKIIFPVTNVNLTIKRFLNNAYFVDSNTIYICNLDTSVFTTYPTSRAPYVVRSINFEKTGSQTFSKAQVDFNPIKIFDGVVTNRVQEREELDVFSVNNSYDDGRVFNYSISNRVFTLEIELPRNNSIKDLEIFKYVVDIRIRYSKRQRTLLEPATTEDPNVPPVPIDEMTNCIDECESGTNAPIVDESKDDGCKVDPSTGKCSMDTTCDPKEPKCNACFKRCTKNLGSVGRVLGYVDSDFSVVDFLNIYKSV